MREATVRAFGLAVASLYAVFVVWLYVNQPQTVAEVTGRLSASVGGYRIDQQAFDEGLRLFREDRFAAARSAFERADPARQDARTRFYIAYTFYRQGWGRVYHDDELYAKGLEAVSQAIALAPRGTLTVDDPNLDMRTADQLQAELEAGRRWEIEDFNPLKVFRRRK